MEDKTGILFTRKAGIVGGGSLCVTIPPELQEFCDIHEGDDVIMTAYSKTKGKFIAFWKK